MLRLPGNCSVAPTSLPSARYARILVSPSPLTALTIPTSDLACGLAGVAPSQYEVKVWVAPLFKSSCRCDRLRPMAS